MFLKYSRRRLKIATGLNKEKRKIEKETKISLEKNKEIKSKREKKNRTGIKQ